MDVDAEVGFCAVCTLRQITCLVYNFRAPAQVTRFNLIMHLALTKNIILQSKTNIVSQKINSPNVQHVFVLMVIRRIWW